MVQISYRFLQRRTDGRWCPLRNWSCRPRSVSCRSQLGLLYSSCSGSTKEVAYKIHERFGDACCSPIDVQHLQGAAELQQYAGYIVGAPTYNTNATSQRTGTAWDDLLYNGTLEKMQLQGKPFLVFGCGDARRFKNNFADAIGELHDVLAAAGGVALTASYCCPSSYLMQQSKALRAAAHVNLPDQQGDNGTYFVGMPLDSANQPELTDSRISRWCSAVMEQLQQEHPGALQLQSPSTQQLAVHSYHGLPTMQQHQQQLHIGDWAAEWPFQGKFNSQYPKGFVFTDRWYQLGDRWYRFADEGFQVRAGFREHAVYSYAYRDVTGVEVCKVPVTSSCSPPQQQQWEQAEVEVRVSISSRGVDNGVGSRLLVLRSIESWSVDGSNTIADFLRWQMCQCTGMARAAV